MRKPKTINLGSLEHHPYKPFIPKDAQSIIIGTFPIGKFTNPDRKTEIKEHEINFNYGGEGNLLWKLLSGCFNTPLKNEKQIKEFLNRKKIAMADVIKSCRRDSGRASDSDLHEQVWHCELGDIISEHNIKRLYFTSQGAYDWYYTNCNSSLKTKDIILLSPSANGARAIGRLPEYKSFVKNGLGKTKEFTLMKYKEIFNDENFPDFT